MSASEEQGPRRGEPFATGRFLLRVVSETFRLRLANSSHRARLALVAVLLGLVAFGRPRRRCPSRSGR